MATPAYASGTLQTKQILLYSVKCGLVDPDQLGSVSLASWIQLILLQQNSKIPGTVPSVLDLDPDWIRFNQVSGSGSSRVKMTHENRKKLIISCFEVLDPESMNLDLKH